MTAQPTPTRRAFLVFGPESSGTRLLTRFLLAAGCDGDGWHEQRFDKSFKGARDVIVWRRSLPHGNQWPDFNEMLGRLHQAGYRDVRIFSLVRSYYAIVRSQVKHKHVATIQQAAMNVAEAIFRTGYFAFEKRLPICYLTFETLTGDFPGVQAALRDWGLNLTAPPEALRDANAEYVKGE